MPSASKTRTVEDVETDAGDQKRVFVRLWNKVLDFYLHWNPRNVQPWSSPWWSLQRICVRSWHLKFGKTSDMKNLSRDGGREIVWDQTPSHRPGWASAVSSSLRMLTEKELYGDKGTQKAGRRVMSRLEQSKVLLMKDQGRKLSRHEDFKINLKAGTCSAAEACVLFYQHRDLWGPMWTLRC